MTTENAREQMQAAIARFDQARSQKFADEAARQVVTAGRAILALASLPSAVPEAGSKVDWRHKLWMVACHATGGGIPEIEGVDRSINDICVQISAHNNAIWKHAQESALSKAAAAGDEALREAIRNVLPIGDDRAPDDKIIAFYIRMGELRAIRALASNEERLTYAALSPSEGAIPAGMVPWAGGDSAPEDWDGGDVLWYDGVRTGAHPQAFGWKEGIRYRIVAYTPKATPSEGAIPAGMKAWPGGNSAPEDWDGGPVLCNDGDFYGDPIEWLRPSGGPDVIAYYPRRLGETAEFGLSHSETVRETRKATPSEGRGGEEG